MSLRAKIERLTRYTPEMAGPLAYSAIATPRPNGEYLSRADVLALLEERPHDPDTLAKVAFAEMVEANYRNSHWFNWMSEPSFHDLLSRHCEGDRSPELVAQMQELTARMQKEATDAG